MGTLFGRDWDEYVIDGLVEISLPDRVDMTPSTVGWKVVLLAIVTWLLITAFKGMNRYRRNRYRRIALNELMLIQKAVSQGNVSACTRLPELLKSTAMLAYSREQVAHLYGGRWEAFLDGSYCGPSFAKHCPEQLHRWSFDGGYKPCIEDANTLIELARLWIQTHRVKHD